MKNDVLDLLVEWFTSFADEEAQGFRVNGDAIAFINGEFDLDELADYLVDQLG